MVARMATENPDFTYSLFIVPPPQFQREKEQFYISQDSSLQVVKTGSPLLKQELPWWLRW